jgi:hypothetical protein
LQLSRSDFIARLHLTLYVRDHDEEATHALVGREANARLGSGFPESAGTGADGRDQEAEYTYLSRETRLS